MKRVLSFLAALVLLLSAVPALAENAPTSQFGFKGWPYRQSVPCKPQSAQATACPENVCPAATAAPAPTAAAKPAARPTAAPSASTGDYTTISLSAQEQKVLNLLNQDRQRNGLSALPEDPALSRLARLKAQDMRDQHYFAHESPTYGNAASMLRSFGYAFNGVGENIAHHANVEKAEAAFMSSSGHRANILGSQWTKVGVGVSIDENGFVYVTQLFAR